MGVAAGVGYSEDVFTAPDAGRTGASFRNDISAGVAKGELPEIMGAALFVVIPPADEFQPHPVPECGRQGGGKDWRLFAADDADGVEPGFPGGKGSCEEVIGPGAAEGDHRISR